MTYAQLNKEVRMDSASFANDRYDAPFMLMLILEATLQRVPLPISKSIKQRKQELRRQMILNLLVLCGSKDQWAFDSKPLLSLVGIGLTNGGLQAGSGHAGPAEPPATSETIAEQDPETDVGQGVEQDAQESFPLDAEGYAVSNAGPGTYQPTILACSAASLIARRRLS
ncbi:hypothetical protein MBLNU457_1983t2 [Dothideomycetes sp. NU457]